MTDTLPLAFMGLCAAALVAAVFLFSRSFAALFGGGALDGGLPRALSDDQQSLLDEKRALLVALRDLETERELGKVSNDDYGRLEAQYRGRARKVLQQLDGSVAPFREEAEKIVREHLARRGISQAAGAGAPDAKPRRAPERVAVEPAKPTAATELAAPEAGPVERAEAPAEAPDRDDVKAQNEKRACASCTTSNDPDAAFCKKCGKPLEASDA